MSRCIRPVVQVTQRAQALLGGGVQGRVQHGHGAARVGIHLGEALAKRVVDCFAGGQQTNCRINNLIYQEAQADLRITLWFHATEDYKTIERELLDANNFNWNRS